MYPNSRQLNNKEESEEPYERKVTEGKTYLLVRIATNKYRMTTTIENKRIYMKNLLNFNLINLMRKENFYAVEILNKFRHLQKKYLMADVLFIKGAIDQEIKMEDYFASTDYHLLVETK
jgi:hypothetical protein